MEGATQQPVINAEEAMRLVEGGEVHRKVSATAANAGSSRSHTFVRVSVESSSSAAATGDEGGEDIVTRRLSSLNLIDLAGSEAAKVQQSRLQSREGSYINKSLLALGTVIAKLGDSNSKHIPFRDSKLTRLLASSLSGDGAKVCVICTATPTGSQAEETHNTLKFATRAKAVHVRVHRQETCNARELLIRYQQEVADLRQQLWRMRQSMGLEEPSAAPLPPEGGQAVALPGHRGGLEIASLEEVLSLRERLEEERAVRLKYEREREELQQQVDRLTAVHLEQVQAGEQVCGEATRQGDHRWDGGSRWVFRCLLKLGWPCLLAEEPARRR